ncbi:MAG: hypothetical protein RL338_920 [Chloroflexota bacterium]
MIERGAGSGAASVPVVVILGGPSAEHDVSIVSGTAVAEALGAGGRAVEQVLIDLDGRWWWLPDGHRREGRPAAAYDDPAALGAAGPFPVGAALDRLAAATPRPVAFIALHGPFGEDGTLQALLEAIDLPYTGSGVAASALGMDKAAFKRLARAAGLPVVDWVEVRADRWAADRSGVLAGLDAFAGADPRLMTKPSRLGSSIGMTIARDAAGRPAAIEAALRHDPVVLVERYLPSPRELEVSVIGNDPTRLEVHGPGEVFPGREFYDYEAKYAPGVSRTTISADLPPARAAEIRDLAAAAYRAIGAEGFARVDFLLAGSTLVVSEINTIPGFTPISLFPTMPSVAGLDFRAVAERIVALAVERHAGRIRRRLTPGDLPR